MLPDNLVILDRCHGKAPYPVIVDGQALAHVVGKLLPAYGKKLFVHLIVQFQQLFRRTAFQIELLKPDILVQPIKVVLTCHAAYQLHGCLFQKQAQEPCLFHQLHINQGNAHTPLGKYLDDAGFLAELDDRLAHGCTADSNLL